MTDTTEKKEPGLLPEKAALLLRLKQEGFNVPEFIYVPPEAFQNSAFGPLEAFLSRHQQHYKVIARSAHPLENRFKGGTFDSLDTYADVLGITYARSKIIKAARTSKSLSIKRQQKFLKAPELDLEQMGIIVMPFVEGSNVMAKMILDEWEFGYCRNRNARIQSDPYITKTPHDRQLMALSRQIQTFLDFPCEIEYIISETGEIFVVQAKDISNIEVLEQKRGIISIHLAGVKRIRKRRSYRERTIYVLDTKQLYMDIIAKCEEIVLGDLPPQKGLEQAIEIIHAFQNEITTFALAHQRFAILGMSIKEPRELYQIANHYLDDFPDLQKELAQELNNNLYQIDFFLFEADTLIAKDRLRINLGSHDAYGIDTVRNPMWNVFWHADKHEAVTREFAHLGFSTGDTVGIFINKQEIPTVYRL